MQMKDWAEQIKDLAGKEGEVYPYFNDHVGRYAVGNGKRLRDMVK